MRGLDTSVFIYHFQIDTFSNCEIHMKTLLHTICLGLVLILPQTMKAAFSGDGAGIEGDPYVITTPEQLTEIKSEISAHYKLGNDIDLAGSSVMNATSGWVVLPNFSGVLDGDGHKITGFWTTGGGFIGGVPINLSATIKNLGIELDPAKGIKTTGNPGAICTYVNAGSTLTVSNCYVIGDITGERNMGALVGDNRGTLTIEDSYAKGTVTGSLTNNTGRVGGLVGYVAGSLTILRSYFIGEVIGAGSVGGIVGQVVGGVFTLENCYADGAVNGVYNDAGGTDIGAESIGGLVGNWGSTDLGGVIKNCYAINAISSKGKNIGGIIGYTGRNVSIVGCVAANPSVESPGAYVGDVAGFLYGSMTFSSSYAYEGTTGSTLVRNNGSKTGVTVVAKSAIVAPATYAAWDFENVWTLGNADYRLPVLKELDGQPTTQPSHLPLSSDAKLKSLRLNVQGLTPAFDVAQTTYTIDVPYRVENIGVNAEAEDANASVTINGNEGLVAGANTITVTVKAEDQATTIVYTITVNKAAADTDATLKALSVNAGNLSPAFAFDKYAYTITVPYATESIEITATANTEGANISGAGTQTLTVGENVLPVEVTATNGTTKLTYTITVTRSAAATNATLKSLSVNAGTLSPAFSSSVKDYTVSVGNEVTGIEITAAANDTKASVAGAGLKENLVVGANTYTVEVTAEDGTTKETYKIVVTRSDKTSINDVSGFNFTVNDRSIVIEGAEGIIALTSMNGNTTKYIATGSTTISVDAAGIYILSVNEISYKILVK